MTQAALTEFDSQPTDTTLTDADIDDIASHPATDGIDVQALALNHPKDGWNAFPKPSEITTLCDENHGLETASLPAEVRDAQAEIDNGVDVGTFLVMDAHDVYEYLAEIQRKSDKIFENFNRRQNLITRLSNGNRNGKSTTLETYDKSWLDEWETRRRMTSRGWESWPPSKLHVFDSGNDTLPNASE